MGIEHELAHLERVASERGPATILEANFGSTAGEEAYRIRPLEPH